MAQEMLISPKSMHSIFQSYAGSVFSSSSSLNVPNYSSPRKAPRDYYPIFYCSVSRPKTWAAEPEATCLSSDRSRFPKNLIPLSTLRSSPLNFLRLQPTSLLPPLQARTNIWYFPCSLDQKENLAMYKIY